MIRCLAFISLALPLTFAADFSVYRGFKFGASPEAITKIAGSKPGELKTVHTRPILIQELEWHPGFAAASGAQQADPVREGVMNFYGGALYQIAITYDRQKVEGMSENDMIDAMSSSYGTPAKPGGEIAFHSYYAETAAVLARWEDPQYSYNLVRTGDQSSFALVMTDKRTDALAQTAIMEAKRTEALAAPQKALDLEKKQAVDAKSALNKARAVNVPNFRP